jgi:hypothetical protein
MLENKMGIGDVAMLVAAIRKGADRVQGFGRLLMTKEDYRPEYTQQISVGAEARTGQPSPGTEAENQPYGRCKWAISR